MGKILRSSMFALFVVSSVMGECDIVVVADRGGIGSELRVFDQMYLTNGHTLAYVKEIGLGYPDGTYVPAYSKNTRYYMPTAYNDVSRWSISSSNQVVNGKSVGMLKRGEGICWSNDMCRNGCLFYISGKEIPAEIKCPDSYRQAQDILHYIGFNGGQGDQNVLFDPILKKQFNIVFSKEGQFNGIYSKEYDFPFFPYSKGMEDFALKQAERKRDSCLCSLARSGLAGSELSDKISGPVLLLLPCEYRLVEKYHDIPTGYRKIDNREVYPTDMTDADIAWCIAEELGIQEGHNTYTNLFVSAIQKDGEWKVSGLVGLGKKWWDENDRGIIYLLDDSESLRMSGEFDYHSWVKVHDADGNVVAIKRSSECKFEEKLNAAFNWTGEFTLERLLQRVKEDEERIRKAREE